MAVRLKDIAADLGVSTVTVSKVLRNQPDVGEETRKRVLQRVKDLNYKPNLLARGLASGKSQTVGLIVPNLIHTFFAEFAKGLKAGLRQRGYLLILASADEEPELEREEIDNLLARGVDALLVASCQTDASGLASMVRSGVPFALVDRVVPGFPSHFVGTDDVAAGRLATAHLIAMGGKRIAHIAGEGLSTARDRLTGYQEALQAASIPYDPELVVRRSRLEELGDDVGYSEMRRLLRLQHPPDAVFCYNDLIAVGAIRGILSAGLRVPQDVSVIGCGNLRLAEYLRVPLSSLDQVTREQGEQAAKLTVSLIAAEQVDGPAEVRIMPRLIVRASTMGTAAETTPWAASASTLSGDTMSANVEHGPSSTTEINPKVASDIHYWSKEFGVTGEVLHEAIRVHGTHVSKVKAALAAKHEVTSPQHEKAGA